MEEPGVSKAAKRVKSRKLKKRLKQIFICNGCNKSFKGESVFMDHLRTNSFISTSYERRSSEDSMNTNLQTPSGEKPFWCEQCNACFSSLERLNEHSHSPGSEASCSGVGGEVMDRQAALSLLQSINNRRLKKMFSCYFRQEMRRKQKAKPRERKSLAKLLRMEYQLLLEIKREASKQFHGAEPVGEEKPEEMEKEEEQEETEKEEEKEVMEKEEEEEEMEKEEEKEVMGKEEEKEVMGKEGEKEDMEEEQEALEKEEVQDEMEEEK